MPHRAGLPDLPGHRGTQPRRWLGRRHHRQGPHLGRPRIQQASMTDASAMPQLASRVSAAKAPPEPPAHLLVARPVVSATCPSRPGTSWAGKTSWERSSACSAPPIAFPASCVLPGEAGIGKTTLWLAGVDAAADRGYRILSSRPIGGRNPALVRGVDRPPRRRGRRRRRIAAGPAAGSRSCFAAQRAGDPRSMTAPSPPPSSKRCGGSPATVRSALRSTTFSGWTRLRWRRFATRSPAWKVSRSPRCWRSAATCRSGFAVPYARTDDETIDIHRAEPRRDPRAATRPPRRDVSAADADQTLGDLAR